MLSNFFSKEEYFLVDMEVNKDPFLKTKMNAFKFDNCRFSIHFSATICWSSNARILHAKTPFVNNPSSSEASFVNIFWKFEKFAFL